MFKRTFFFISSAFAIQSVLGQGITITSIESHHYPKNKMASAAIITDTLDLPFFDDFTFQAGYPELSKWTDNQVWINNTFSLNQPNYNMATFDHLDSDGRPYTFLNKNESVYADSLTSQPINMAFYKNGANTFNYVVSDSIYLTFYVQRKGLGDLPESSDSLILFFKDNNKNWQRVWWITGSSNTDFLQYAVLLNKTQFLHRDFQFRFVNYTKATGNLNQWHLDYIRLDKNRNNKGLTTQDVGIVRPSYRFFKFYHTLPKSHYLTDVSAQTNTNHFLQIRNLNSGGVQTRFSIEVRNKYNTVVYSEPFSATSRNILGNDDSTVLFNTFRADTFSGENPGFKIQYTIDPQSNDGTPIAYNASGNNNQITAEHTFTPWYAYDDGSAEGGFGLDYADLGSIKGQFAMKFENLKDDSLRGLAIYFNRSESDVSTRSFYLRIWKNISPLGQPDNQDQMIYEYFVDKPAYTDSINHFSYFIFDTILPLPKGTFYIGWRQNQPFILNVGYDNNYRYLGQETGNPNLYYNLLASWERADFSVKGVPMLRPLLGKEREYTFNTKSIVKQQVVLFPNPFSNTLSIQSELPVSKIEVYDFSGRNIFTQNNPGISINTEFLKPGSYLVTVTLQNGQQFQKKTIKI